MLPASMTSIPGDKAGELLAPTLSSPLQAYAWRVYLVLCLLALIGFFLMPSPSAAGLWFSGTRELPLQLRARQLELEQQHGGRELGI